MSYLSPQAGEIAANNSQQPTDMTGSNWMSVANTHGSYASAQASQGTPWLFRQPPRIRQTAKG
jgi:hypothetical protein